MTELSRGWSPAGADASNRRLFSDRRLDSVQIISAIGRSPVLPFRANRERSFSHRFGGDSGESLYGVIQLVKAPWSLPVPAVFELTPKRRSGPDADGSAS
ncbi:hypothetical protein [Bosea sp. Root381]|uniref:hypothetical protein n=1 Tax=Bosea sp. Root381 TaxID=1736524 RepID=UPI0012E3845C|nr:hypothetical protein [Bosea sp. Root381]